MQINPLSTIVIEKIMIPHLYFKITLKFKSNNSRTKEGIKYHFSGLNQKINFQVANRIVS